MVARHFNSIVLKQCSFYVRFAILFLYDLLLQFNKSNKSFDIVCETLYIDLYFEF